MKVDRDFSDTHILVEFGNSLEISLRTQLTESGLYIGQLAISTGYFVEPR
jgi:hypothetical protein